MALLDFCGDGRSSAFLVVAMVMQQVRDGVVATRSVCYRAATKEVFCLPPIIKNAVVNIFGVCPEEIDSASRGCAQSALARQVAMYLVHVNCGLSLTETGSYFERDRTTVAHACHLVENQRDDPNFDRALGLIERALIAWSV